MKYSNSSLQTSCVGDWDQSNQSAVAVKVSGNHFVVVGESDTKKRFKLLDTICCNGIKI